MSWNEVELTIESSSLQCPIDGISYAKLRVWAELSATGSHDDFELEVVDLQIEILACPENTPYLLTVAGAYCERSSSGHVIQYLPKQVPNPAYKAMYIDYNSLSKGDRHAIDIQLERAVERIKDDYSSEIAEDILSGAIDRAMDAMEDR